MLRWPARCQCNGQACRLGKRFAIAGGTAFPASSTRSSCAFFFPPFCLPPASRRRSPSRASSFSIPASPTPTRSRPSMPSWRSIPASTSSGCATARRRSWPSCAPRSRPAQPQPDVLLIADVVTMEGLKAEGRLMAYPEADVSGLSTPALLRQGQELLLDQADHHRHRLQHQRALRADELGRPHQAGGQGLLAMPSPLDLRRGDDPHRDAHRQPRRRAGISTSKLAGQRRAGRPAAMATSSRPSPAATSSTA